MRNSRPVAEAPSPLEMSGGTATFLCAKPFLGEGLRPAVNPVGYCGVKAHIARKALVAPGVCDGVISSFPRFCRSSWAEWALSWRCRRYCTGRCHSEISKLCGLGGDVESCRAFGRARPVTLIAAKISDLKATYGAHARRGKISMPRNKKQPPSTWRVFGWCPVFPRPKRLFQFRKP